MSNSQGEGLENDVAPPAVPVPASGVISSTGTVTDMPGPHKEPGDHEEVYYEGSPPARGRTGRVAIYSLIGIVFLAIAVLLMIKHTGPWWLWLGLIVIGMILPTIPMVLAKTVRYRISNYRIDYERGMLGKQIDTLELWHVEDLHFYQSLIDRILNVGNITVISKDETMPKLEIVGVPNPRPLYEMMKQRVIAVKRQRGVMKVDQG